MTDHGAPKDCKYPEPTLPAGTPAAPRQLSKALAVGRSPVREELAILAAAGYRTLINNRPDTETDSPLTSAESADAAAGQGLAYCHIPVEGRNPLERDVRAFAEAIKSMPGPAYAYCQTGGRSASLWALASVVEQSTADLVALCKDAGFDISGLAAKMDMRRELLADEADD